MLHKRKRSNAYHDSSRGVIMIVVMPMIMPMDRTTLLVTRKPRYSPPTRVRRMLSVMRAQSLLQPLHLPALRLVPRDCLIALVIRRISRRNRQLLLLTRLAQHGAE